MAKTKWSWTQPCCSECWVGMTVKIGKHAAALANAFCCYCRADITGGSGYLVRVNPGSVPYPTMKREEE